MTLRLPPVYRVAFGQELILAREAQRKRESTGFREVQAISRYRGQRKLGIWGSYPLFPSTFMGLCTEHKHHSYACVSGVVNDRAQKQCPI